jgi:16S rRNA (adenine1518-N6/adenine1519-N6)-dimethyltransferase
MPERARADASAGLGAGAIRDLAARHGIRPKKSLGQNFLIDPNVARAIAADAGLVPGDHVVEIGAGLGSLTVALAATGAEVLAIESDRKVVGALEEVVVDLGNVRVIHADVMKEGWGNELLGGPWVMCANLPYGIAVPLLLDTLAGLPSVARFVITVQREVGERLAAQPGDEHYGAASVRVAYHASAKILRRVSASVFWPRPKVESVVVGLARLASAPVAVDPDKLWRVVAAGFAERRKTMRSALRRLGLDAAGAVALMAECGLPANARAEELGLDAFASIAEALPA